MICSTAETKPFMSLQEDDSFVDQLINEVHQIRVLIVGSTKGKAQLLREIFGVNRIQKTPHHYGQDDELYSSENDYFVAHAMENWVGVDTLLRRRKKMEEGDQVHSIWHYVDSQDALEIMEAEQRVPSLVRKCGIPIITVFGRFDSVVKRSSEIGNKRRNCEELTKHDIADAAQIRAIIEAINLYSLQFPDTTTLISKPPGTKVPFLNRVVATLKTPRLKMLLIMAQRLNPSLKFEASLDLAMKQFLLGTISTASPLPIPFAGLVGSSTATYLIKSDIVKTWNLYDPDNLITSSTGQSFMDTLMDLPAMTVKRLIYMIPVIGQINGIWEVPRMARALGGLMIDLTLLMERLFLSTMAGIPEASGISPRGSPASSAPGSRSPSPYRAQTDRGRTISPKPYSTPERHNPITPSPLNPHSPTRALSRIPPAVLPKPTSISKSTVAPVQDLGDLAILGDPIKEETATLESASLERISSAPKARVMHHVTPVRESTASSSLPGGRLQGSISFPPPEIQSTNVRDNHLSALVIRPSALPITRELVQDVLLDYDPIKLKVKEELAKFFEIETIKRSFQKALVREKLGAIVRFYRLSEGIDDF